MRKEKIVIMLENKLIVQFETTEGIVLAGEEVKTSQGVFGVKSVSLGFEENLDHSYMIIRLQNSTINIEEEQ